MCLGRSGYPDDHRMAVKPKPTFEMNSHAAQIFGELKVLGMHLE